VLAHCGGFQEKVSDVCLCKTLLTRSWLYEVTQGANPQPAYQMVGYVKDNVHVKGQLFAVEEIPGFHERHPKEEDRRFIVLSEMRKAWPSFFIKPLQEA
jgi:hypothetical protein